MKNLKFILLGTLLLTTLMLPAQRFSGHPSVEELHQHKWDFMMKEVQLSPAEVIRVKPVFLEYEKSMWGIHKEVREMYHKTRDRKPTKAEYKEINDKSVNLQIREVQYLRSYHLKLSKLLDPETLFNYYNAERKFKRLLLSQRPPFPLKDGDDK